MDIVAQNGLRKCETMSRYYNDELYHFGIKHRSGRYKWGSGERPYQGEGGVKSGDSKSKRSKAGQVALGVAIGAGAAAGAVGAKYGNKYIQPTIQAGKGKPNESFAEKSTKLTGNAISSIQATSRQLHDTAKITPDKATAEQMSKMSNKELQEVITRKNLEQQYLKAIEDPAAEAGYQRTQNILSVAATSATVLTAAAGIYSAYKLAGRQ